MNLENLYTSLADEIIQVLPVKEIDKKLKLAGHEFDKQTVADIDAVISKVLAEKLSSLNADELKDFVGLSQQKRSNYFDVMQATRYDDGLVCTIGYINVALIDHINNYAMSAQTPTKNSPKLHISRKERSVGSKEATDSQAKTVSESATEMGE